MLLWSHAPCFLHVAYAEFDSKRIILAVSGHRPCRSHLLQEALPELRVLAVLPLGSFPMLPLGCLMHSPFPHPPPPLAMELAETRPDESLSPQHLYLRSLRVLVRKALKIKQINGSFVNFQINILSLFHFTNLYCVSMVHQVLWLLR